MTTLNKILKESKEEFVKKFVDHKSEEYSIRTMNMQGEVFITCKANDVLSFIESLAKRVEEETIQNLRNVSRQRRQVILFPEKVSLLKSPEKERQRVRHWYHRKINKFFEDCPKCNVEMNKRMIIQNTSVDLLKQSEEKKGVK